MFEMVTSIAYYIYTAGHVGATKRLLRGWRWRQMLNNTIENVLYDVTFSLSAASNLHHHIWPYISIVGHGWFWDFRSHILLDTTRDLIGEIASSSGNHLDFYEDREKTFGHNCLAILTIPYLADLVKEKVFGDAISVLWVSSTDLIEK